MFLGLKRIHACLKHGEFRTLAGCPRFTQPPTTTPTTNFTTQHHMKTNCKVKTISSIGKHGVLESVRLCYQIHYSKKGLEPRRQ
eukprot:598668-Amphidinium_carterae.1